MKNRLPWKYCLAIWLILFACFESGGHANAQDPSGKDSVYLAATVLDKKIYLRSITPEELARNRAQLSEKDFARWQSESRWRPLVRKVSYQVMSDWAKRNNVTPTREDIQKHFANEARQHLQKYNTPEGEKRVAFALQWCIATTSEWATAKALYEKYGGRIALSSFGGCVAIDGRNALLKEYAATGKIPFHDPAIEKEFWVGVDNPAVLDVTVSDPKRISNHFTRPPWEGWGVRTAKVFEQQDKQNHTADGKSADDAVPGSGGN